MNYSIIGILSALALFILMILLIALGHHFGKQRAVTGGLNITEGAVFTLMALLVAFTFSSASQRFDQRRIMIIEEANAIGTAYLRLDMLKPDEQSALRKDFMMYINSRLAVYKLIPDFNAVHEELKRAEQIKAKLWRDAVAACANSNSPSTAMLILPAIKVPGFTP
ncbi:hypothetical protein AQUSIP_16330 [Aquicella siphonis]|uniref:DUF4239 domain-containing protein n=1 Tax=Aquicella siphonis TaxID=254247 RepID=A0A5E4PIW6_9COXI|nr:hypothetical protein [Aquicella siphonis]VVC76322.1 hypothetical protein AQUSIP_16330 [Aquicella siphonis]